jgi:GT2 family glycosyltransferase
VVDQSLLFSVVIPTYNRPDRLCTCLQALSQLDYPGDRFEVSITPLTSVVEPFQTQIHLTLLHQANAGPAAARNRGAAIARGEFLVFTDDDCAPHPDWLRELEAQVQKSPQSLIGGYTVNALAKNIYSTASQLLIDYLYTYYNHDPATASFFASNNFALSRERFQVLGGFDTTFPLAAGEDREFCDRWLQAGYTMTYAPAVQIDHAHSLTLRTFWRQHFNYGRGAFCFHQLRAQRQQQPVRVEPITFYTHLLTYPFSKLSHPISASQIALLFFLSQLANVAGFFWQKSGKA